jgi:hypothetical protein
VEDERAGGWAESDDVPEDRGDDCWERPGRSVDGDSKTDRLYVCVVSGRETGGVVMIVAARRRCAINTLIGNWRCVMRVPGMASRRGMKIMMASMARPSDRTRVPCLTLNGACCREHGGGAKGKDDERRDRRTRGRTHHGQCTRSTFAGQTASQGILIG